MMILFELLGELGSGPVWLFRAWGYIFSSEYRTKVHFEYSRISMFGKVADFIFSLFFFVTELALIAYVLLEFTSQ